MGLSVAVTGATGDFGLPLLRRLDAAPEVAEITAIARGAFDPFAAGLTKVRFLAGDVLDAAAMARGVAGADVVVHLAFLIFGPRAETRRINLDGCRNVFTAARDASVRRIVYASSAAVYGFHERTTALLPEETPSRPNRNYAYTGEKVATERMLTDLVAGTDVEAYRFRSCVVGGPESLALVRDNPYRLLAARLPTGVRRAAGRVVRPVVLDAGVPMQLVHASDVVDAFLAGILGAGPPGAYNLAAPEELSISEVSRALGWPVLRIPRGVARAGRGLAELTPWTPPELQFYAHLLSAPVLVDCTRARKELGWQPRHDGVSVLAETVAAARARGLL
ncbi:NAD-dependent epimerase/dehydratase family protein [Micromonospora sp. WMMD1120]|uniref:NAD-dependent epimerase/dehydratase family protein n=1 Tax=Micromonospora sp. WMMD1120 TaxID=3016106 RepID=UPI002416848A|nr:NAD-dependent epimerase/dehydratase family protein [Micromonospora sp. WMMD1120]MDG4810070.1 NAD-dependent epimerase/dehydratase family protein [Micromonospora sp. WMMD1120]